MIVQFKDGIEPALAEEVEAKLAGFGLKVTPVATQQGRYLVALGDVNIDIRRIGALPGVRDVHRVSDSYKLVSRKWKVKPTVIDLGDGVTVGGGSEAFMLGPCSLESEEQVVQVAEFLQSQGVRIMRGAAFKPRTSPYAFRGLGLQGLKMLRQIVGPLRIKVISEVLEPAQIEAMYPYIDVYQVGTRNSQNFSLLHELGKVDKPVLIKRGMSGTLDELMQSAEYVFANGNERIMLCERGIRTMERAYRNTFDINAIPVLREKSHLPVIADPSHGIGLKRHVPAVALACIAAGADGLLMEIHPNPRTALTDADQTLNFAQAEQVLQKSRALRQLLSET